MGASSPTTSSANSGGDKKSEDEWRKHIAAHIKPCRTLLVVNFDETPTSASHLRAYYRLFGELTRVDIRKKYAFVQFVKLEDAKEARVKTNGGKLNGKCITVEYATREDAGVSWVGWGGRGGSEGKRRKKEELRKKLEAKQAEITVRALSPLTNSTIANGENGSEKEAARKRKEELMRKLEAKKAEVAAKKAKIAELKKMEEMNEAKIAATRKQEEEEKVAAKKKAEEEGKKEAAEKKAEEEKKEAAKKKAKSEHDQMAMGALEYVRNVKYEARSPANLGMDPAMSRAEALRIQLRNAGVHSSFLSGSEAAKKKAEEEGKKEAAEKKAEEEKKEAAKKKAKSEHDQMAMGALEYVRNVKYEARSPANLGMDPAMSRAEALRIQLRNAGVHSSFLSGSEAAKKIVEEEKVERFTILSLLDPNNFSIIKLPVKGPNCTHLSCFDLETYVRMNAFPFARRYLCPICSKVAYVGHLKQSGLVTELIKGSALGGGTGEEAGEEVRFHEDGHWEMVDGIGKGHVGAGIAGRVTMS